MKSHYTIYFGLHNSLSKHIEYYEHGWWNSAQNRGNIKICLKTFCEMLINPMQLYDIVSCNKKMTMMKQQTMWW